MNIIEDSNKFDFTETAFKNLMEKRIRNVLIICSRYDFFMLEEDGRVDEQIFNEYVSLNLRYPPTFIQASNWQEASNILKNIQIDLIINMLSTGNIDPFELSRKIKNHYPEKPIVVLTPFSREILMRLHQEDLTAIDYVFSWLGHADILLAIIKLIEDKMNVMHDVEKVGVQTIILVEDNIRFYSSYLPIIYKILFRQSKELMTEGLNEHQKMLRMRGRPKILLATNYEQAVDLYNKYKNNLLGIISDISYKREGTLDPEAGLKLCEKIKKEDDGITFLLQSSDIEFEEVAYKMKVGFIYKHSKTLLHDLKSFIIDYFSFGDFIFRMPESFQEITRASDLHALQNKIFTIPDESLEYHIKRNDFSKWLTARALFPLAEFFKPVTHEQFSSLQEVREFLFDAIEHYRMTKGRGVIGEFEKSKFNKYIVFSRVGDGSVGGKARGLAFINSLIKENKLYNKYPNTIITIPKTVVLSTDVFDEFMESNNLYKIALSDLSDEEIHTHFMHSRLPFRIHEDLLSYLSVVKNPIAVRSSSILEDSHYQPFAGVYSTYMIPKVNNDIRKMVEILSQAIKGVYASVFYKSSKAYMAATHNVIDEEKMSIVLQEICGRQYGERFYPTISGVARSVNFYPIGPENAEDGIVNIAFGLGKVIVEGGISLRFSPKHPRNILQLSSPEFALRDTQKKFIALDLNPDSFKPSVKDDINLLELGIKEAENDNCFKYVASTYDYHSNIVRDGISEEGKRIITFSNILNFNLMPLAEILNDFLQICKKEMNNHVEIEFAVNMDTPKDSPFIFNFLQVRPIVQNYEIVNMDVDKINKEETVIFSTSALGNGIIQNIRDIVYVKPEAFNPADNLLIAQAVNAINEEFIKDNKNYILIGPGRWGSSDPWLGIPVKWAQISAARLIIESGLKNYRIDPSQGTHFFQNLTSFRVGYFTINPFIDDGYYDLDYLNNLPAVQESKYLRHVRTIKTMEIKIDGKQNIGVVYKPDFSRKVKCKEQASKHVK
ncbi:MAG: PEP/pyruvate-binding domain-containing protein [Bacteroidales bacterium]|nr:PEP/pyruvate-binding domain-containing protein [Bacteroidales bacterium]